MSVRPRKWFGTASLVASAALVLSACSAGASNSAASSDAPAPTTAAGSDAAGTEAGSAAPSAPAGAGEPVTLALTGEPTNLDFTRTAGAAIPLALMNNVYEGLVTLDQDGEIQPLLAESWEISDDRTQYTFTLNEGVTFSNGDEFDAEDVKFSFERVKSDDWGLSLKNKMNVVESVEAVSPTEVTVTLSEPSNQWLFDITTSVGAIFTPDGVASLETEAIGTGPFTVSAWNRGQSIELAAREDYWGDAPAVSAVSLRYFADAIATTNALRSGDVDAIINMQAPDLLSQLESAGGFEIIEGTSNGEIMLSLNNQAAPFDDIRVRQAVFHAIDRQAVMDTAWAGYGSLVGTMVPPTDPYYEDLNDVYPYDPEKAKALLAEAGQENLSITFDVPTRPYAAAVSEIVVSQLAEVGITATISSTEFPAVWLEKVFTNHDYQMTTILAVEPRDILTVFNDPEYYIGYDNSTIAPLAEAAVSGTEEEYLDGMKQVARQIVEDAASPVLFLFPNISVAKTGLTGVPANANSDALVLRDLAWS